MILGCAGSTQAASATNQFILWANRGGTDNGLARLWVVDQAGNNPSVHDLVRNAGWTATDYQAIDARRGRLLMAQNIRGPRMFQIFDVDLTLPTLQKTRPANPVRQYGPFDAVASCYWLNADGATQLSGTAQLILTMSNGEIRMLTLDGTGAIVTSRSLGVYPGWKAQSYQRLADGQARLLLSNRSTGRAQLWFMENDIPFHQVNYGPFDGYEAVGFQMVVDVNNAFTSSYPYGRLLLAANDTSGGYLYAVDAGGALVTPGLRYYGYWGNSGWCAEAYAAPVPDVTVQINMDSMICQQTTNAEDRDETYLAVVGDTASFNRSWRLPPYPTNDDYYEFRTGSSSDTSASNLWTNQDQAPVGTPLIWSGTLSNFQSAQFLVVVREQDAKNLGLLRSAVKAALGALSVPALARPVVAAADALANGIPDIQHDDVIGAFTVRVKNCYGRVQVDFLAIDNINLGLANGTVRSSINANAIYASDVSVNTVKGCNFAFDGTGSSHYSATVDVRSVGAVALRREYLGYETGGCDPGNGFAAMADRLGVMHFLTSQYAPNNLVEIPINSSNVPQTLQWFCGFNVKSVNIPAATGLVLFGWHPALDVMFWRFREIPW